MIQPFRCGYKTDCLVSGRDASELNKRVHLEQALPACSGMADAREAIGGTTKPWQPTPFALRRPGEPSRFP
jgi:hypothetical protein